jgi:hypothetical protein
MFKKLAHLLKSKRITYLILLVFIIPSFSSLFRPGFYSMQDDLQAFRIYEMDKCIADFQIPCRWIPDAGYQYGYPLFNFYAPGVYYLGETIHLLGFQFIDSVKILFILGFVLSAVSMYVLVSELFGPFVGVVASVLYTYAPFKAQEVYVRGALSEFWVLTFFPLVFWSSYKLLKDGGKKYSILTAVFLGLLFTTHNLLPVVFLPVVAIWILFWLICLKKLQISLKLVFALILSFGLAAFFVLPVLFERQFVHVETLLGGYFDYRQHFVSFKQIFFSNTWGYGSSSLGPNDDLALSSGIVLLFGSAISLITSVVFYKKNKKISALVIALSLIELLALFLMHAKSAFIWESIGFLKWLQFPWRFLSISIFLLSIITACGLSFVKKWRYILGITLVVLALLLHGNFFKPKDWLNIKDSDKFSGISWEKQLTISIFDYLPIYSELPPNAKAPDLPEILSGKATFENYTKGSNYQGGSISVYDKSLFRLPLFDFPGMRVTVDGKLERHSRDCRNQSPCLGLITFEVPEGYHSVKAELTNTPIRILGNFISLISMAGIVAYSLIHFKNEKSKRKNI